MKNLPEEVGVDVSKAWLDVHVPGAGGRRFANDVSGVEKLKEHLPPGLRVHLESSGGYDFLVTSSLRLSGFEVVVHNPRKVSRLSEVFGSKAKTDRLDATLLSRVGNVLAGSSPVSDELQVLRDQSRHVQFLSEQIGALKVRLKSPGHTPEVLASLGRQIEFLTQERTAVRSELHKALRKSSFWARYRLFLSVKCLGQEVSRTLALELPLDVLGHTVGQVCSYAGLVPLDRSSGQWVGKSRIGPGNARIKRVLYIAALIALACREELRKFYDRLKLKGKPHQQAIVAVMHKLLKEALAVLKRGTPWTQEKAVAT